MRRAELVSCDVCFCVPSKGGEDDDRNGVCDICLLSSLSYRRDSVYDVRVPLSITEEVKDRTTANDNRDLSFPFDILRTLLFVS